MGRVDGMHFREQRQFDDSYFNDYFEISIYLTLKVTTREQQDSDSNFIETRSGQENNIPGERESKC